MYTIPYIESEEFFYLDVFLKLLLGLLALALIINKSDKGNLAPSSAMDQVQNYVLGGIIGGVIYNNNVRILDYVGILCIWCILVLTLKWIKKHNVRAKQLIDGKALIIIDNGKLNVENCKKAGLCAHDVAFKLRTNNIYSTQKVKRAFVEQNGQLIIIQSGEENPRFPIITDGRLQTDILEAMGKNEEWILKEMKKQGFSKYSEIFLGEYVDGKLNFIPYN